MASEEFVEGSRIRRRDPNLYLGLPPLPGLLGRPGMIFPMPDAPAPQEMPPLPVAYSPSNALSTPELLLTEPMLSDWLDALRAGEHAVTFGAPSYHATVSPSLPPPQRVPLECVERLPHPLRVAPAAGGQMISTRELRRSTGGAIEDMTPELRLRRVIQVSQHHNIVRPGLLNRNQRSTSPEAERLVQAIHQSHIALDALRRQKLDGKMGADNKDGNCGCNSSFECNICLEAAKEPIVTQCGHLFCWPCLYQWLHGHSAHSECPVCKGEVLEVNVTPIYGRGGDERDAASNNIPPRPRADRTESLRQQLQISDPRGIASMVRRLMENQDIVRGQAASPVGGVFLEAFSFPFSFCFLVCLVCLVF
uniref:Uncharacterized protein n=1 Tax=Avena sativa TaxID=4498 RepID=A0ACD5ZZF1_AVESA